MNVERKIKMVAPKLSFAEAEESDLIFWANKSIAERLQEVQRLRKIIWKRKLGKYPEKMEHIVKKISKSELMKEDVS